VAWRAVRVALVALAGALVLAGCAAAPVEVPSWPPVTAPARGGQAVADLGLTTPVAAWIWLPDNLVLTHTADQPNLLIVAGPADQAGLVEDYLRATLPGLGWTITADAPGALLFERAPWHGAYALGDDSWALTARND
jgi:hypothetical protein